MTGRFSRWALIALIYVLAGCVQQAAPPAPVTKVDRHAGYYYPNPSSIEVYKARAKVMEGSSRRTRIGFIVAVNDGAAKRPYPSNLSFFAKGTEAEKLIIVSNVADRLDTIYRVRALLATLTASARMTPIFRENSVEDILTFLDLLKMLGFKQITVSDGDVFAHQILIK